MEYKTFKILGVAKSTSVWKLDNHGELETEFFREDDFEIEKYKISKNEIEHNICFNSVEEAKKGIDTLIAKNYITITDGDKKCYYVGFPRLIAQDITPRDWIINNLDMSREDYKCPTNDEYAVLLANYRAVLLANYRADV